MSDEDSLVATRSRRSNAGSRLKHLIELEERVNDVQESVSSIINEEDENVNLLFQEDEDDQEFVEEDEDEEEDEENEEGEGNEEDNIKEVENKKRSYESDDEVEQANSDDVLSDSDISLSESDESEGEKELQKQERMKQKRIKKKQSLVPTIKQPKLNQKPKAKKPKGLTTSDSLLLSMRRSSSRSTAVENKEALVQKLKENEKRRAKVAPIVRVKHVDLTQEEKLAEAIETEKANILSLQQFQDQEIVKKERQKQLLLLRKVQLKNVIRMVSDERLITPLDEINEDRHMRELMNIRSRKKLGRKKKITKEPEVRRLPGEVDTELPIVKQELEQKRIQEVKEAENNQIDNTPETTSVTQADNGNIVNENIDINKADMLPTRADESNIENENIKAEESLMSPTREPSDLSDKGCESKEVAGEKNSNEEIKTQDAGIKDDKSSNAYISKETTINDNIASNLDQVSENTGIIDNQIRNDKEQLTENDSVSNNKPIDDSHVEEEQPSGNGLINQNPKEDTSESKNDIEAQATDSIVSHEENSLNSKSYELNEVKEEKRVKFADELEQEQREGTEPYDTNHSTPDVEFENIPETFEGPPQRVARNMVYLIDFEEDKDPRYRLDGSNIKAMLFGSQSLLPASRRFKDLKTILRIGEVENPYAAVKQEKDELFEPVSELTEDNAMFDELKRLPKLGITQAVVEEIEEDTQEENAPILLKTEAPTGIYLPNGNKKVCLISGTEVKYFDPSNGIPYSSVDTYRFLKTIEQGNVPWYSIDETDNDNGPVELYLGSRDGTEKHAKGVPEGFDS